MFHNLRWTDVGNMLGLLDKCVCLSSCQRNAADYWQRFCYLPSAKNPTSELISLSIYFNLSCRQKQRPTV